MKTVDELKTYMNGFMNGIAEEERGKISEYFADIVSSYEEGLYTIERLTSEVAKLTDINTSLVKANGELFMRVGQSKEEPTAKEDEEKSLTFEEAISDIIDEKGRIK